MKATPINSECSQRICNHMNKDHENAVIAYARFYGGLPKTNKAALINISPEKMELLADETLVEISFDHTLLDSEDAHQTLISMLKAIPKDLTQE